MEPDCDVPVAVVDIGKTHTKLLLVDAADARLVLRYERRSGAVASDIGPQLDVRGIEDWLLQTLAAMPHRERLQAIVPMAHGAAAVLLDREGAVLAAPDYDNAALDELAEQYRPLRDDYAQTFSPWLPRGLNLGRQLHWLSLRAPQLWSRCTRILTYPQYWAWRLSGTSACEVTSLGCHTDLWLPLSSQPSSLALRQGWTERLPPLRGAHEVLGGVSSSWLRCGLPGACRVVCGIHDSNASYLAQRLTQPRGAPFASVSSGTWTVVMTGGVPLDTLVESNDMLANVDARGHAVATARFAGGREYEAIAGQPVHGEGADEAALQAVLRAGAMALPGFAAIGGPYARHPGRLVNADSLPAAARAALAALYVALMTDLLLDRLQACGDVLIDGPLAADPLYPSILASLRRARGATRRIDARHGACLAAAHLAGFRVEPGPAEAIAPILGDVLDGYRWRWRTLLPEAA